MKKSIKKNFIYNVVYQLLLIINSIFVISYVSNVLGENAIGKYSFSQTLNSYFIIFASLNFVFYGRREVASCRGDIHKQSIVFWEVFLCRLLNVILFSIINFVLIFSGVFGAYTNLLLVLSINLVNVAIDVSFFFYGNEDFFKVILVSIIVKILGTIGIFICVKDPSDLWLYVLLNIFVALVTNLTVFLLLKNKLVRVKLKDLKPLKHLKKVLILSLPCLAVNLYGLIDNSLIGFITQSDAENGFYAQSEKIIRKVITLINCLSLIMLSRNTYEISQGNVEQVKKNNYTAFNFIWLFGVPMVAGIVISARNFIPWFLGPSFNRSIVLTQILSFLIIFIGISTVIGEQYLLPNKKDKHYVWAIMIGVVVSFIVNIPLIYFWGSVGAALTTVISEFVIMFVMLIFVAKELSLKKIFGSMVKPLVATLIMCAVIFPLTMYLSPGVKNTFIIIASGFVVYLLSILILRDKLVMSFLSDLKVRRLKRKEIEPKEQCSVNKNLIEEIDVYDEEMNPLGTMEKVEAHQKAMWHKSVHLWITDGKNVLLQLRSAQKKSFPNKWDISVAGHVSSGETPFQAIQREYQEELGLAWDLGDVDYGCLLKSGTIENGQPAKEFLYLYFVKKDIDLMQIKLPKDEVDDVKYISYDEFIKNFMKEENEYIPYSEDYKNAVKEGLEKIIKKENENE